MNHSTQAIIQSTFEASNDGRIHFGQVIAKLIEEGVESYHVDCRAGRATYYPPDGTSLDFDLEKPPEPVSKAFDSAAVRALLRAHNGCHVAHLGRRGETHVERFRD